MKSMHHLFCLSFLLLGACSGGGSSGGGNPGGGVGSLELLVTDAPFAHDIVSEARIAITEVRIHRDAAEEDSGFLELYEGGPIEFDLLDLQNGVTRELVRIDLPEGEYRQLRLVISDASLTLVNGNVYSTEDDTLQLTSTGTSGFKVFIDPPIQVVTNTSRTLLLDFDLTKTFHPIPANDALDATRYQLHPVIRVANLTESGVIRGVVTADDGTGQQVGVEGATVRILAPGELDLANSIATSGTRPDGRYAVIGLAPGFYDVVATEGERTRRVDGQQVFAGNATIVDLALE